VLGVEKRQHKAEITIDPPNGPIVGMAQTSDMVSAVNEALDHLQKQALKYKTKWLSKKRKAVKKFDSQSLKTTSGRRSGWPEDATFSVLRRFTSFHPSRGPQKVHLVHAKDSVALRPLTLEEAIKEAHFRDKERFRIPRSPSKLMVLIAPATADELIEAPVERYQLSL